MFDRVIMVSFESPFCLTTQDKYQKQAFHFLAHTLNISGASDISIFFYSLMAGNTSGENGSIHIFDTAGIYQYATASS